MRQFSLLLGLLLVQVTFAQRAGTAGKFLRNEASASDINSVRIEVDIEGNRNRRPDLQQYRTAPGQYQWNPAPYGAYVHLSQWLLSLSYYHKCPTE